MNRKIYVLLISIVLAIFASHCVNANDRRHDIVPIKIWPDMSLIGGWRGESHEGPILKSDMLKEKSVLQSESLIRDPQ